MDYIVQALVNRKNEDYDKPFWLYDIGEQFIMSGDILCKNRGDDPDYTFDYLAYSANNKIKRSTNSIWTVSSSTGSAHTDIIVDRVIEDGNSFIYTLGGNTLDLGPNGDYTDSNGTPFASAVGRKKWKLPAAFEDDIVMVNEDNSRSNLFDPSVDSVFAVISITNPVTRRGASADDSPGGTWV